MADSSNDAKQGLLIVALCLLILFTLLGNSLVLCVLLYKAKWLLKKPLYIFICNICFSDVLATLFTMTFEVSEEIAHDWQFGEVACKMIEYLEMTLFGVNIFTHFSIALERYRNVVQPLKPQMKLKAAKILVVVSWCVPSVMSLPYLYTLGLTEEEDGAQICSVSAMPWTWLDKLYLTIEILVIFLVPLGFIVWMYVLIVIRLCRRQKQANAVQLPQRTQATMRAAATYGSRVSVAVATVFLICWMPFTVVNFVRLIRSPEDVGRTSTLYVTALYSSFVSELLTPLLYCAFDRNIKPILIDTIRCRSTSVIPRDESLSDITGPRSRAATLISRRNDVQSRDGSLPASSMA